MTTIFISHRAEYAKLVRDLKRTIQLTSRGKIEVFISEDIPRGDRWREAIEDQLRRSESLFLVYGAPYEDWSWCFYEAGYFAALDPANRTDRRICCILRPGVPAPGPLSNLQMVTDGDQLIAALIKLYDRLDVDYNAADLRAGVNRMSSSLFGQLAEFVGYPRIYLMASESDFRSAAKLPESTVLKGDQVSMNLVFGIGASTVDWAQVAAALETGKSEQEKLFASKWIAETVSIVLAARDHRFQAPQTVLIGRGGRRFRFLLYSARIQGDGTYCCEFLVIDEVGGPAIGLPSQLLSLLTGIRMGFRFRFEFITRFDSDAQDFSEEERRARIQEIPQIISNLEVESETRGNFNLEDLLGAFDGLGQRRLRTLVNYWPIVRRELFGSLGLSADGTIVSDQGLRGPNMQRFSAAFEAARLINTEFLSRCCACVSGQMKTPDDELTRNADRLKALITALEKPDMPTPVDMRAAPQRQIDDRRDHGGRRPGRARRQVRIGHVEPEREAPLVDERGRTPSHLVASLAVRDGHARTGGRRRRQGGKLVSRPV
jgi:hypothetical protein